MRKRGSGQLLLSFDTEMKKYPRFSVDRRMVWNVSRDIVTVHKTRTSLTHVQVLYNTSCSRTTHLHTLTACRLVRTKSQCTEYSYGYNIVLLMAFDNTFLLYAFDGGGSMTCTVVRAE